jgi:hypothetical protein
MDVPVFVGIDEQARVGTLQLDARVSLAELAAVKYTRLKSCASGC